MIAAQFYSLILDPAATMLSHVDLRLDTPAARCLLLAIAGQESAWTARLQVPYGEARGFWQCQENGMVAGVMLNDHAHALLERVGTLFSIEASSSETIWQAIAWHDPLAYTLARLGLWMDPEPLPAIGDADDAFACYVRNWRPGKPSRERWAAVYPKAVAALEPKA